MSKKDKDSQLDNHTYGEIEVKLKEKCSESLKLSIFGSIIVPLIWVSR